MVLLIYDKFRTSCTVDLANFPFDVQKCNLEFTHLIHFSYGCGEPSLRFYVHLKDVLKEQFTDGGEWDLVSGTAMNKSFCTSVQFMPVKYPYVVIDLVLKRRPTFYVLNLMVPSVFVSILSVFVFLLPTESGEKISLQITVFLSYMVLILVIADITPTSGVNLPRIGKV